MHPRDCLHWFVVERMLVINSKKYRKYIKIPLCCIGDGVDELLECKQPLLSWNLEGQGQAQDHNIKYQSVWFLLDSKIKATSSFGIRVLGEISKVP